MSKNYQSRNRPSINITLPKSLIMAAREYSNGKAVPLSRLIERLLEEYLNSLNEEL